MGPFHLTRTYHFSAGHRLENAGLGDEENARIYGPCHRQHGHNYLLEVTVAGVRVVKGFGAESVLRRTTLPLLVVRNPVDDDSAPAALG